MKQWLNLTKKDMAHLKENNINTKAKFWDMRKKQAEMVENQPGGRKRDSEPCWECWHIENKLNQVVKLFDLGLGDKFKVSLNAGEWEIVNFFGFKGQYLQVENSNSTKKIFTGGKDNKDVIKVER